MGSPKPYYTPYGDPLFSLADLSRMSGATTKQIRPWIENGELTSFITAYVDEESQIKYYKLGQPYPEDRLIDGSQVYYTIQRQKERPEWAIRRRDEMTYQYRRLDENDKEEVYNEDYETSDLW